MALLPARGYQQAREGRNAKQRLLLSEMFGKFSLPLSPKRLLHTHYLKRHYGAAGFDEIVRSVFVPTNKPY